MSDLKAAADNYDCLDCLRKIGVFDPWAGEHSQPTQEELAELDQQLENMVDPTLSDAEFAAYLEESQSVVFKGE